MTSHRPVALVVALALALVAAGCGARWTDAQREELISRSRPATETASPGRAGTGSGSVDGPTGSVAGPATGGADAPGGTDGGTTGGGTGGTGGSTGPLPCTAPSDAPGVTDDTISVGSLSSLSGPVPGLGATAAAAVRSYVAFRNATGGVCGRQIDLNAADDGTDNARFRALLNELAPDVLGLVGGLGGGDAGGADLVESFGLPVVVTAISPNFGAASTVFNINPPFDDVNAVTGKYRFLFDQGVRTASIVYIGVDQSRAEAIGKHRPLMEAAGIQIVNVQELPLATLSYDSAARSVANSGADFLFFLHDAGGSASMARSLADTGYDIKVAEYLTAYGSDFPELAGSAAEGATSWTRTVPNEEAGSNAEQAAFLEWMDRTAPGTAPDTFAADSWVASKAFFDSLETLPGPISREALLAHLRSMETYEADGMLGPIRFAANRTNGCAIAMIFRSGSWERWTPQEGFLC